MVREWKSWWIRDLDEDKLDFEWFLSPLVLQKYWEYMHKNRKLKDWSIRDSDNWQKWFGEDNQSVCVKSLLRHVHDIWMEHRGFKSREGMSEAMMWSLFNIMALANWYYNTINNKKNGKRQK